MINGLRSAFLTSIVLFALPNQSLAEFKAKDCATLRPLDAQHQAAQFLKHLPSGAPSSGPVRIRRGYVMQYDAARRVPRWAAWHASKDYRTTPDRDISRWGSFHSDPVDGAEAVTHSDYGGIFDNGQGYARGHIVPYFISGGDRDGDGMDAELEGVSGEPVEDPDDACTVFEINQMSNISPQLHNRFNGSGGLWGKLEKAVRKIVDSGKDLHLIAGPIFGPEPVKKVGPNEDIHVPHMFFKIVVSDRGVVGFLFAHERQDHVLACPLTATLQDCIAPIDAIEEASGLDFFSTLSDDTEALIEAASTKMIWNTLVGN